MGCGPGMSGYRRGSRIGPSRISRFGSGVFAHFLCLPCRASCSRLSCSPWPSSARATRGSCTHKKSMAIYSQRVQTIITLAPTPVQQAVPAGYAHPPNQPGTPVVHLDKDIPTSPYPSLHSPFWLLCAFACANASLSKTSMGWPASSASMSVPSSTLSASSVMDQPVTAVPFH